MKILVTGAGGFIGVHLTAELLKNGHHVVALDNYNDYYSPRYKLLRFNELVGSLERKNLSFENFDLCDEIRVEEMFAREKPEVVVHLAGQAGVRLPFEENYKYVDSNIVAFGNIIKSSLKWRSRAFMYASSSSVYGDTSIFPLQEDSSILRPISFYGFTKLVNEIWAKSTLPTVDTQILGMRFFSVYGPWGRPDMAYFKIIRSLYSKTPFKMFGNGTHVRDMTHVRDVVQSIELLTGKMYNENKEIPPVVNIGGGHPHSLLELITALEGHSGRKLLIEYMPASNLDVLKTEASFSSLFSIIRFSPTIDLYEGSKSLVDWANKPEVLENLVEWSST